jgi:hypothetical protein
MRFPRILSGISFSIILLTLAVVTNCLFEREKGLNDWHIESLGELKDLKFIENSPLVYTLSTTKLLTLYDTLAQKILWKKELPP